MSKPMFMERISEVCEDGFYDNHIIVASGLAIGTRCRVSDARRPSARRSVEKVLSLIWSESLAKCGQPASAIRQSEFEAGVDRLAARAGMTARIVNGKVKCQWRYL